MVGTIFFSLFFPQAFYYICAACNFFLPTSACRKFFFKITHPPQELNGRPLKRVPNCPIPIGTLRSDDGDGNSTKAIGLISKTTISHVHHAFLYISLPSMHDYDAKMSNFTLYRGSAQATTKFPLTFCTWLWFLEIQL